LQVLLPHDPDVKLESVAVSKSHIAVFSRSKGLQRATIYKLPDNSSAAAGPPQLGKPTTISFDEGAYTLESGGQVRARMLAFEGESFAECFRLGKQQGASGVIPVRMPALPPWEKTLGRGGRGLAGGGTRHHGTDRVVR
jgi:hypothetical protein